MKRSWLILTIAFGALIALIGLLGLGAMRQARAIHRDMTTAHEAYLQTESFLRDFSGDVYLTGILARDYLLDPSHLTAPLYRKQLLDIRTSVRARLDHLGQRLGSEEAGTLRQLRAELRDYWDSHDPIFDWTPAEKAARSYIFLRQQILPRRNAVIALAQKVASLNAGNLRKEQERVEQSEESLQRFLGRTLLVALSLGVIVAVVSATRVSVLERRDARHLQRVERAEHELRRLSRQLVQAQEEERKSLSRELHDAVGQMLTGMGMTLANLDLATMARSEKFREHLEDAKRLNADTIRLVRDLSMGLRPSMLDDIGLAAALQWQGREFSRRSGVPVSIRVDGNLDGLPETLRTCVYRVFQEALTNCARYAQARNVCVSLHGAAGRIHLTIQDDGVGFAPDSPRAGLGLLGIEERVRELEGTVEIVSQPQRGTILKVELPVPEGVAT